MQCTATPRQKNKSSMLSWYLPRLSSRRQGELVALASSTQRLNAKLWINPAGQLILRRRPANEAYKERNKQQCDIGESLRALRTPAGKPRFVSANS